MCWVKGSGGAFAIAVFLMIVAIVPACVLCHVTQRHGTWYRIISAIFLTFVSFLGKLHILTIHGGILRCFCNHKLPLLYHHFIESSNNFQLYKTKLLISACLMKLSVNINYLLSFFFKVIASKIDLHPLYQSHLHRQCLSVWVRHRCRLNKQHTEWLHTLLLPPPS